MNLPREFHIPTGAQRIAHKHSSAVAYVYTSGGRPCAMVFSGKATKPTWRYSFLSLADRERRVSSYFAAIHAHEQRNAARKAERKALGRGLAIGDVLQAMWGYEQTNIDWYEVTALIGDKSVEVRKIAGEHEETHWQQGKTVPMPGAYVGEPIRRRATDGRVRIDNVRSASRVEPLAIVGGKPVYAAAHFTAYH